MLSEPYFGLCYVQHKKACHPGGYYWDHYPRALHAIIPAQLIWRSDTCRFNLRVPDYQMSFKDLTTWQGTRIAIPAMTTRQQTRLYVTHNKLCSKVTNQWGCHFTLLCDLIAQTGGCLLILIFFHCQTGQYSLCTQGSFQEWAQPIRDDVIL